MMMMGKGMAAGAGRMGLGMMAGPWGILVQVGIILLIVAVVYFIVVNRRKKMAEYSAMETLKMKLVEGEITEEEYNQRKEVLKGK